MPNSEIFLQHDVALTSTCLCGSILLVLELFAFELREIVQFNSHVCKRKTKATCVTLSTYIIYIQTKTNERNWRLSGAGRLHAKLAGRRLLPLVFHADMRGLSTLSPNSLKQVNI